MRHRALVPLIVGALATCAWLQARGVGAIVGARLGAVELHVVPEAHAASPAPTVRSADAILTRNPFDSITGPLVGGTASAPWDDAPPQDDDGGPCEDVRVVSIAAFADPDGSFVMLDVRDEPQPLLRRRGGIVQDIRVDRVVVARDGRRCVARMFAPPVADANANAKPAPSPSPAHRGIVATGPSSFAVDRGARDALIEGTADLMHSVMVRPEKTGDDVIGLRIATLKPGTALDALGVRAGDVLESLDGIPLTAPDRMLEAFARARTAEHLRIVVRRDGREQQLDYDVR